jgi:hypothetical protein
MPKEGLIIYEDDEDTIEGEHCRHIGLLKGSIPSASRTRISRVSSRIQMMAGKSESEPK